MYEEALALKQICKNKALFLINDRVDIALAMDADGVHIGTDDMPYEIARRLLGKKKMIGLTVHNIEEAKEAARAGAGYIGVSPIFATGTKPDAGKPAGISLIKEAKKAVKVPVAAIGGITLENVSEVIRAGADAVCAISAVVTAEDAKSEIEKFLKLFLKKA
jgi:thiamine-phosphate pyrophosphorylase